MYEYYIFENSRKLILLLLTIRMYANLFSHKTNICIEICIYVSLETRNSKLELKAFENRRNKKDASSFSQFKNI